MNLHGLTVLLLALSVAGLPSAAQDHRQPGPLIGERSSTHYRGPGFTFYLPEGWTIEFDEIAGAEQPGERGTARGGAHNEDAATTAAADATIRFEPYPRQPGATATLEEFEAHIRATLAAGVPVARFALARPAQGPGGRVCPEGPPGLALLFARKEPGPDGQPATRRSFVWAHIRTDGRVQSLICSHLGPAGMRRFTAMFMHIGESFTAGCDENGGRYRLEHAGFILDVPPAWRVTPVTQCGSVFWGISETERRRMFNPILHLARTEGDAHRAAPDATLITFEIAEEFPFTPEEWFQDRSLQSEAFAFDDGATGRVHESESTVIVLRMLGARALKVHAIPYAAEDREHVLTLIRGAQLVEPPAPEQARPGEKQLNVQGISISYPGDWQARTLNPGALGLGFSASFQPIEPAGAEGDPGLMIPMLHATLLRLDDLLVERQHARAWVWPDQGRVRHSTSHEDLPFATRSGWDGWLWTSTTTGDGPRRRSIYHSVEYVLPMPDGITALYLAGQTVTLPGQTRREAEELERVWRRISEGAEVEWR
jgi:hypothetical protein